MAKKRATATGRKAVKRAVKKIANVGAEEVGRACTVVYIHGIGNKPIESILKCQWDHALFGYDLGGRSRLAYWVNREYYPSPSVATCATGDVTEVENAPTGRALSVQQHLEETGLEEEVAALTSDPREQKILLNLAERVDEHVAPARVSGVQAT